MAVQHETELYAPLKAFFEQRGYIIKGEVKHCDLVGVHEDHQQPLIVEIKKSFNLPLLLQGLQRQKLSSTVYLAVERNRQKKGAHNQRWSEVTALCRRLGLGLIAITIFKTKAPFVEILCDPGEYNIGSSPKINQRRSARMLNEFNERSGDYNVGGSHGAKLMTSYREKALRIAIQLEIHHEMSPRQIRDITGIGQSATMLQHNYYGWFQRISRGRYGLTQEGVKGLSQYTDVIASWKQTSATVSSDTSEE